MITSQVWVTLTVCLLNILSLINGLSSSPVFSHLLLELIIEDHSSTHANCHSLVLCQAAGRAWVSFGDCMPFWGHVLFAVHLSWLLDFLKGLSWVLERLAKLRLVDNHTGIEWVATLVFLVIFNRICLGVGGRCGGNICLHQLTIWILLDNRWQLRRNTISTNSLNIGVSLGASLFSLGCEISIWYLAWQDWWGASGRNWCTIWQNLTFIDTFF